MPRPAPIDLDHHYENLNQNLYGFALAGLLGAKSLAQPALPPYTNSSSTNVNYDLTAYYSNNLASVTQWLHDGYRLPSGAPADLQTIMDQSATDFAAAATNGWQQSAFDSALTWAFNTGAPSQITNIDGNIAFLVSIDEFPLYVVGCNVDAAQTISTDKLWPGGSSGLSLNGTNRTIMMWDEGKPRLTHSEFGSRVSMLDNTTNLDSHSTGVAGTLAAAGANNIISNGVNIGPAAKGMSFAAKVQAGSFTFDYSEMVGEAGTNKMRLSNHSYEHTTGWFQDSNNNWYWFGNSEISTNADPKFGNYTGSSSNLDMLAVSAPNYLGVWASGNDTGYGPPTQPTNHYEFTLAGAYYVTNNVHSLNGEPGGYAAISDYACAKNILTVGAVFPAYSGYTNTNSVVLAPFSSCGPTDDGRIKPDVVADGVNVITTDSANDYAYVAESGTSFAAPSVAGSINLLAGYYQQLHTTNAPEPLSSTLKGLVIHTADQSGTNLGPSYRFGWGLMNTTKAAGLIGNDATNGLKNYIKEVMLNSGQSIQFPVVSAGGTTNPLRVTIAWTDPAGRANALTNLDNPAIKLINDLDLRVVSPTGVTNFPYVLTPDLTNHTAAVRSAAPTTADDTRNNVEQVFLANPTNGTYLVRVTHKGTITNSQWVSIIVSGNTAQTAPPLKFNQVLPTATNAIALGWPAVVGQRYQVQYVDTLHATNAWQNIGAQVSARLTNVVAQIPFTNSVTKRYYRLVQLP